MPSPWFEKLDVDARNSSVPVSFSPQVGLRAAGAVLAPVSAPVSVAAPNVNVPVSVAAPNVNVPVDAKLSGSLNAPINIDARNAFTPGAFDVKVIMPAITCFDFGAKDGKSFVAASMGIAGLATAVAGGTLVPLVLCAAAAGTLYLDRPEGSVDTAQEPTEELVEFETSQQQTGMHPIQWRCLKGVVYENRKERTILLLGPAKGGKTSALNALANCAAGTTIDSGTWRVLAPLGQRTRQATVYKLPVDGGNERSPLTRCNLHIVDTPAAEDPASFVKILSQVYSWIAHGYLAGIDLAVLVLPEGDLGKNVAVLDEVRNTFKENLMLLSSFSSWQDRFKEEEDYCKSLGLRFHKVNFAAKPFAAAWSSCNHACNEMFEAMNRCPRLELGEFDTSILPKPTLKESLDRLNEYKSKIEKLREECIKVQNQEGWASGKLDIPRKMFRLAVDEFLGQLGTEGVEAPSWFQTLTSDTAVSERYCGFHFNKETGTICWSDVSGGGCTRLPLVGTSCR